MLFDNNVPKSESAIVWGRGGLGNLRKQRGVFVWRVDIQRNKRIIHGDVLDVILVVTLDLAGAGRRYRLQEHFNQFAARKIRMPVLAR